MLKGLELINFLTLMSEQRSWKIGEFHVFIFDFLDIVASLLNFQDEQAIECISKLRKIQAWYMPYLMDKV